jgi:ABC-type transporter Mla subunit MlaD
MRRLASLTALLLAAVFVIVTGSSSGAGQTYLVRAIFDNAAFAVPGENVRISGADVGSIQSLDVTPQKQAAVVLQIGDPRFTPFHTNATCAIRPQSLIGEKYVDCEAGTVSEPALQKIPSGSPGAGQYLLPIARTSSPIDSDIVQDIYQEPIRERFGIILNELGTGLAGRGSDLNAVIHRANPALGNTDKVLKILAAQNKQLAQLASDSNAVLTPLAKVKAAIGDFITQANTTSVATAARASDEARSIQLFPPFLRALRPLMVQLGKLADQGTPLMASLGQSAGALGRQFQNLTPFAKAARPALIALGKSSAESEPALLATIPLAKRLGRLGTQAGPSARLLNKLLQSLSNTGGINYLMHVLFYGTTSANGFDSIGHYARVQPLVGGCVAYVKKPVGSCSAHFAGASSAADVATATQVPRPVTAAMARAATGSLKVTQSKLTPLRGLLRYLIGGNP